MTDTVREPCAAARRGVEPASPGRWAIRRDVPYVPTDDAVVRGMLKLGAVTRDDVVYDLGCGDGRIVIAAARRCGAYGVGVEIDPQRLRECAENGRRAAHGRIVTAADGTPEWAIGRDVPGSDAGRVRFLNGDLLQMDFHRATVLMLYLLPKLNETLVPKFLSELRPGSRIVSNTFPMGYAPNAWLPDETLDLHHRHLMKWIVPAPVAGTWRGIVQVGQRRHRLQLVLTQKFQRLHGFARLGDQPGHRWRELPVGSPRISGPALRFHLPTGWTHTGLELRGQAHGPTLRGHWTDAAGQTGPWCATRI